MKNRRKTKATRYQSRCFTNASDNHCLKAVTEAVKYLFRTESSVVQLPRVIFSLPWEGHSIWLGNPVTYKTFAF
jgi:hypothetical protein